MREGSGFARRLSPLIAARGVAPIPNLLIRYQARLGLSSYELVYLLHVLQHRRDDGSWPWVPIAEIAKATASAERSVRDWKAALIAKGYLSVRKRGREGGGRGADEHDLSGLFAALEALAIEEELQRASDQARERLPAPRYFHGMASVPQLGTRDGRERPRLQTERVRSRKSNTAESRRIDPKRQNPAAIMRPVPASEKEPGKQNLLTPPTPKGESGGGERPEAFALKPDDSFQPALPRTSAVGLPAPEQCGPGEELLAAFYRGLGTGPAALTPTIRRRELAIAAQLVAVGAAPSEAEAYAREMSARAGRIAPVDMRSYERERASWLSRREPTVASARVRVVNGRIPE